MRISDWSSDVCSSDLVRFRPLAEHVDRAGPGEVAVLRGDADPQRVVAVGLQVDVERAAHVVLPAGVGQAGDPQLPLQPAGVDHRLLDPESGPGEAPGGMAGIDLPFAVEARSEA